VCDVYVCDMYVCVCTYWRETEREIMYGVYVCLFVTLRVQV